MENILRGAAVVGQSGGPTSAINATLSGVIRGVIENCPFITKLYGMRNGMEGFLSEKLCDLSSVFLTSEGEPDEEKLRLLSTTPASALGSCRKKLPDPDDDPAFYEEIIRIFQKYNIRYFFYIGGNDSMDTVAKLSRYLDRHPGYAMRVVGVPKTIDNDLPETDHAPGYGSAAKYIAVSMQEIIRDCAVYTIPAVTIVEIMGRDAGWLTAASAVSKCITGVAPDYVYLPEVPFCLESFLSDIRTALTHHPNVVVGVSEGLRYADGRYVGEGNQNGVEDVFGHRYLAGTGKSLEIEVKKEIGCKVRSIELNLPQRCAAHLLSATDIEESIGAGRASVCAAISGKSGVMTVMRRAAEGDYGVTYDTVQIASIANQTQNVPERYINDAHNGVTEECLAYIRPLIQGEVEPIYHNGLPVHFVL